jgi:DNA polymerase-3 subunit delta'
MPWDIVGHDWAVRQLQAAVERDEVPHAILITGPESVGKLTLARVLASTLLCKGPASARPCGGCLACRKLASGNHPDLFLVAPEDASGNLRIDQIRAGERFLSLTPNESAHKVLLIDGFDAATINAANALLKTLEEPPAYAHIILIAQDADLLLPTIVSRSQQVNLRPLARQRVAEALTSRWGATEAQAARLARISGGRIGWAVRAATEPAHQQRMEDALALLFDLLQQDIPTRFEKAQELTRGSGRRAGTQGGLAEMLEYWLTGWRDVLLIQAQNDASVTYQERRAALSQIAERMPPRATLHVIQALERAQYALEHNANRQLLIENLFLILPRVSFLESTSD